MLRNPEIKKASRLKQDDIYGNKTDSSFLGLDFTRNISTKGKYLNKS
jgi:hypothetical protein